MVRRRAGSFDMHANDAVRVLDRNADSPFHAEPAHLADPTDSTGAGDAWWAGFICGLIDGSRALDACELGNAAAHYSIQAIGATTNIPSFKDVAELVQDHQRYRLQFFISHADAEPANLLRTTRRCLLFGWSPPKMATGRWISETGHPGCKITR
jgi:bifunctional ADP-heptose synthase (sugar kinase/adenylyltransferase)